MLPESYLALNKAELRHRPRESGDNEVVEEVNMDMGQGYIDTKQELNVDRASSGTMPCTLACWWAYSWLPASSIDMYKMTVGNGQT